MGTAPTPFVSSAVETQVTPADRLAFRILIVALPIAAIIAAAIAAICAGALSGLPA